MDQIGESDIALLGLLAGVVIYFALSRLRCLFALRSLIMPVWLACVALTDYDCVKFLCDVCLFIMFIYLFVYYARTA